MIQGMYTTRMFNKNRRLCFSNVQRNYNGMIQLCNQPRSDLKFRIEQRVNQLHKDTFRSRKHCHYVFLSGYDALSYFLKVDIPWVDILEKK